MYQQIYKAASDTFAPQVQHGEDHDMHPWGMQGISRGAKASLLLQTAWDAAQQTVLIVSSCCKHYTCLKIPLVRICSL